MRHAGLPNRFRNKSPDLRSSLVTAAEALRTAFDALVTGVTGRGVRPAHLARHLQIDKTLAGKLLRAIRSYDPIAVAHEIPAPNGLRIVVDAAVAAGAPEHLAQAARQAIADYDRLIATLPGGRAALAATIVGWLPEAAGRDERIAKQTSFKAISHILGFHAEAHHSTLVVQPSETSPTACDVVRLDGTVALRRLREGHPITVAGLLLEDQIPAPGPAEPRLQTLSGAPISPADGDILVRPFCSPNLPRLRAYQKRSMTRWAVPGDQPPLGEALDLVRAIVSRNEIHRYRTPDGAITEEFIGVVLRTPAKLLILDVFLRDDVFPDTLPVVTTKQQGFVYEGMARSDPFSVLDLVELRTAVDPLGHGIDRAGARELPRYPDLLRHAFTALGWDASRFRGYRCRIMYPVYGLETVLWLELPDPPPAP